MIALLAACSGEPVDTDTGEPPDPAWTAGAPLLAPLQETAVVAMGDEVWVVGGYDDGGDFGTRVEAYDPAADAWRTVTEVPRALHHANAAVVDGRLYVVGLLGSLFVEVGEVWIYDPGTDAWSEGASMPDTTARGAAGVTALDGRIYVVGGLADFAASDRVSAYDPAEDAWEALAPLPVARDHLFAVAVDGRVVAVGGRDGTIEGRYAYVDAYDPATDTWTPRAPLPVARGGLAGAAVDGRVYAIGGEGNEAADSGVFPDVDVWDAATDTWSSLPPMPTPRHGTGAAVVGGTVWVPGGADVQAFGAVATNEGLVVR